MSEQYYCTRPFQWASILDNGNVCPCCPSWVDFYMFGNIKDNSLKEIWNSDKAQEFRKSILDGSFKYCNEASCPHLQSKTEDVQTLHQIEKKESPEIYDDIKNEKQILEHGPLVVNCDYDRSCNLSCPSCRRDVIMVSGEKRKRLLELHDKIAQDAFLSAKQITVTASGDAFASPVFRTMLQNLSKEQAPNLKEILVLTNGLLVSKYWDSMSSYAKEKVSSISFSIDAATAETYAINRRGGKFSDLLENMEFVKQLKLTGALECFCTSFVVQNNNYHEMLEFVELCESYDVDVVQFQIIEPDFIRDLGFTDYFIEWEAKAVHEKTHPQHKNLCSVVRDSFLEVYVKRFWDHELQMQSAGTKVNLGPLYNLRVGKDISQYDNNLEEYLTIKENENKKEIWFDGKVYYVEFENLKTINGTDVARIDTGDIVAWKGSDWEKCSEDDEIATKFMELQNESQ